MSQPYFIGIDVDFVFESVNDGFTAADRSNVKSSLIAKQGTPSFVENLTQCRNSSSGCLVL